MKKFMTITAIILALSLCLCGCGETEAETTSEIEVTEAAQELDLNAVYENIIAAQSETGMEDPVMFAEEGEDIIESYYEGLGNIELKQKVLYMAPVTGFACEVMLVEVANAEDVEKVEEIFYSRINVSADDECYPETAALWTTNAVVQSTGNYVAMVVLPDGYVIPENVFDI